MFRLYDHTRRQICIAAFLGLCVLPTLAVAAWSIARHLPWNKQAEEQRLSQELGLDVSIESMKYTLPGVVRVLGLRLTDPETGQELFRCGELAATWTSMTDSHGQTRPAIVLAATQAESTTSAWQRLEEVLHRRLECQAGRPEIEIRVTADHWTLHGGDESQVLQVVEGGVGLMPNGIQAQLAFRLPGVECSQPVRMWIVRNRQVSPPADSFDIQHRAPALSRAACWPRSVKGLGALGPECRFSGLCLNLSARPTAGRATSAGNCAESIWDPVARKCPAADYGHGRHHRFTRPSIKAAGSTSSPGRSSPGRAFWAAKCLPPW